MSRQYDNRGRDQINIEKLLWQEQEKPTRSRNEQILLEEVSNDVISSRAQSLYRAVLISLGKESQPNQVAQPWKRELRIGLNPATPIPAEQTTAQIFYDPEITGKLLILGQPGAGKTTALLELAKNLVERAQEDINQPIPIILSLSNWQDEKQPIRDWIIAELSKRHEANLVSQWLSDRKLLPLLDGLDEVASDRQVSCVNRINEFLNSEFSPLYVAVCCRSEEYENLANRLQLNGAICLKELTNEQIKDYLTQLERPLLWKEISKNGDLLALVRSPFLLSITLLAYPEGSNAQWQQCQNATDHIQSLLDAYIVRMFHSQIEIQAYASQRVPDTRKTRYWLTWLAQQMQKQAQTEFLIEEMQPTMLSSEQRKLYRLLVILIGWLLLTLLGGLNYAMNFLIYQGLPPIGGWLLTLLGGLNYAMNFLIYESLPPIVLSLLDLALTYAIGLIFMAWFSSGPRLDSITPIEFIKVKFDTTLAIPFIVAGVFIFLLSNLDILLQDGLQLIFNSLPVFLAYGLCYVLFFGLISSLRGEGSVTVKVSANQGIKRSAKTAFEALLYALLATQLMQILRVPIFVGQNEIFFALFFALKFGGLACIQHLALRFILYLSQKAPWDYARFLDYCTERRLLQRVGGRYRFIHKYLQDHFANMPLEQPKN